MNKLIIVLLFLTSNATAQISDHQKKDYLEYLDSQSREAILNSVKIDKKDSVRFWAIYDRYSLEKNALTAQFIDLIDGYTREFEILTEEQEYAMIHKAIDLRKQDMSVKVKYFELVRTEIGIPTAAGFYQNEVYTRTKARLEIMEKIPFIGQ